MAAVIWDRKAGNIKVVTAKKSWLESAASPGSAPSLGSRVLHQEGEVTSDKKNCQCRESSRKLVEGTVHYQIRCFYCIKLAQSCPDARPPSSPLIYIGACVWLSSEQARVRCHCVLNSVRQFWHRCKIMLHNILCFPCWKCLLALSHWRIYAKQIKDTWNLDAYLQFWLAYWWLS